LSISASWIREVHRKGFPCSSSRTTPPDLHQAVDDPDGVRRDRDVRVVEALAGAQVEAVLVHR